ncbi:MAG: hypothetical protein ACSW8F_05295, partial [bacterium]
MKANTIDYSRLTPKTLFTPEYRHLLLLLGWVWYLVMYFITERFIPAEACHLVHNRLDELIPFREEFVIFYCAWYVLLVGSLLYFLLYDRESFTRLQIYIIITQVVAMAVYVCWPSVQDLRPEVMPRENIFTWLLGLIYSADTPTGVCPSLHVGYSLGLASVWLRYRPAPRWLKAAVVALVILIILSVSFVKQHSTWDTLAA